MNATNLLLVNAIFLIIILIVLALLIKPNGHLKPRIKEDIKKIKTQISSE